MDHKSLQTGNDPAAARETDGSRQNHYEKMLGDEQRVKVLSPGMMVLKRFIRNRLAITGLIILVIMFLFSFLGGVLSPYRQDQTFDTTQVMLKEYAGATRNAELRYTVAPGSRFNKSAYAALILAINKGAVSFDSGGVFFSYTPLGEQTYLIRELESFAEVSIRKVLFGYETAPGFSMTQEMKKSFEAAYQAGADSIVLDGQEYQIFRNKTGAVIGKTRDSAIASMKVFDAARAEDNQLANSFSFRLAAEQAIARGDAAFEADGNAFTLTDEEGSFLIKRTLENGGTETFAAISDLIINAIMPDVFLTLDFKAEAAAAINADLSEFVFEGQRFRIDLVHRTFNIKTDTETHVLDMYHAPDGKHLLGTDQNGMDMMTRLMYGGRISLMVGFVVIFLEMFIGILIGGISGYFGGWVDTLLMRFIDLFNCIPYWPILLIIGSVMDTLEVDPYVRVFLLMFILGLLGWTGIARVVRGQILALREQDFMVATEATGVRVSRRIIRHLVPNVMPLLIVQATLGLGGIILTEATLSFLGLGVKYPIASWGSIINAASNPYIVTNYWFIWIPAGLLILLTVLGFNFVGDGLRDAFDPKMKR